MGADTVRRSTRCPMRAWFFPGPCIDCLEKDLPRSSGGASEVVVVQPTNHTYLVNLPAVLNLSWFR